MDAVKSFNQELSSLYEIKPPISKAKMTSITKGAIKAIKFYKHVVQSVEKFIQKCRPEYKIPGLYVIDSIVRQSRHQFGPEKDVFAPRFSKNIKVTFWHLYKCAEDEKSKVIRVLNLWQKNEVFTSDIIQPLFDLANPNCELSKNIENSIKFNGNTNNSTSLKKNSSVISVVAPETLNANLPTGAQNSDQQSMISQLQTIQQLLKNHLPSDQVKFNKKVLDDFDYSDDDDNTNTTEECSVPPPSMIEALQGILGNERVLQQLKNMGAITNSQIQQLQQLLPSNSPTNFPSPINSQMPPPSWPCKINSIVTLDLEEGERVETDEDIQIVEDRSRSSRSKRRRSRSSSSKRRNSRRRSRSSRRRGSDEEREKRKEREKKGLPPIKKDCLSVCSTTLWVGHLSRIVAEDYLSDIFGEYGEIVSINLIPPRGCAFICMNRRMDAAKALKSLYKYKINNKPIILAWAPGKGMKDKQWKDYWDVDLGVSYIPINKLDPQVNMADLEEGGTFDEDTMPEWMKTMRGVAPNPAPQFIPVPEGLPPSAPPIEAAPPVFGLPPPALLLPPPRFDAPPPIPGAFDVSQPPPTMHIPFPPKIDHSEGSLASRLRSLAEPRLGDESPWKDSDQPDSFVPFNGPPPFNSSPPVRFRGRGAFRGRGVFDWTSESNSFNRGAFRRSGRSFRGCSNNEIFERPSPFEDNFGSTSVPWGRGRRRIGFRGRGFSIENSSNTESNEPEDDSSESSQDNRKNAKKSRWGNWNEEVAAANALQESNGESESIHANQVSNNNEPPVESQL